MKLIILAAVMLMAAAAVFADDSSELIQRYNTDKTGIRILFLGNSFTYYNDMYKKVGDILDCETVQNVRGGAYLRQQTDPKDELGANCSRLLTEEKWDYVILQDQSSNPMFHPEDTMKAGTALCTMIRKNGAVPVFYSTWAYEKGSRMLKDTGKSYWEMFTGLTKGYHAAAAANNALVAKVGTAFYQTKDNSFLYNADNYHPSDAGSTLAAKVITDTILKDIEAKKK